MKLAPLPFRVGPLAYQRQAHDLLDAWRTGDPDAIQVFRQKFPRFLDETIPWLQKRLTGEEVRRTAIDFADAQLTLARWYDFADWARLVDYAESVTQGGSSVATFEAGVEAVIDGDVATLAALLGEHQDLVRARSTRVTHFDPPVHRSTLLHYMGANGVEGHRQRTPKNAVEVMTMLLRAGAEVDSLADLYGGRCTTMALLVSSCHPANAGLQIALAETLVDFGASLEPTGKGAWTSPLNTALVFGYADTAEALVRRGARVDSLPTAGGLGRLDDVRRLLPAASADDRHRALALSAQLGHVEVVRLLLDAGEDPNRYNPPGTHSHGTPLHQAVWAGHDQVVRLLVERGARLDMRDTIYQGSPLSWAEYGGRSAIAEYLRANGAPTD